jgi:hydroxypyruvate reductase
MIANTLDTANGRLRCLIDGAEVGEWTLSAFDQIFVIGFGKAAAPMAAGVEKVLGERITDGLVVVKYGHTLPLNHVRVREAAHPVPDENGRAAAAEIAALAAAATERTLVINLISGGGSALLTLPYWNERYELTLSDMRETTEILLRIGADITEINTIRRHLSAVKGGRLAALLHPATSVSIVLSDVVGDELSSIASGPTVPDSTTFAEAAEIIERYGVWAHLPVRVGELLREGATGALPDTPGPGDKVFERASTIVVGSNLQALQAAARQASSEGFETMVLSSRIEGEAREIARFYAGIAADAGRANVASGPICVIAGGETTVTVRGPGKGGRNQEMVAAVLLEMAKHPRWFANTLFVAASTDGTDGPTDAAGGFADLDAVARIASSLRDARAKIRQAISESDSYGLLLGADALIKTGATNTNVCDIQLVLYTGGSL